MDKFLVDRIQMTVENYRLAKEELRNDGDIINHFASLVFSHYEKEIPVERVKDIRKKIKSDTTIMSPFRGDTLNILSLLIATVDNEKEEELIEDMYEIIENLEEQGFSSGSYLALTAFTISKYCRGKEKNDIISKIKELYIILKEKYSNITNDDDYLLCTLWVINNIQADTVDDFIENIFDHIADSHIRSKNGVQGLANAIILNGSSGEMYRTMEFMLQLQKRNIKIANQFLPLLGVISNYNPRRNVDIVEGVIEYLCDEEGEYEYYIDKGFRTIISIVITAFCTMTDKKRYIDELLAQGILSFINSKNKGIFEEVLY
ncbi:MULTISPECIES: DUF4003 family protein [unclassified Clostridium]|uniref:DUF4003 family protein n=1 Tax=unclassified Clostridium TaxID=2614128 RepID=UPI001C8BCECF|nr:MULTISPECIES: DUF4003 family protein [unclassified Clostridium]MBX9138211.1 DUF4003 domain-containing protein [Clostridium sp. K12(2020)]MBX9144591.1 DUF4003 domain-containing protein [Clostridium sp. K13]MDU4325957.1 DUF4003 family protein [Clostridium celatum]